MNKFTDITVPVRERLVKLIGAKENSTSEYKQLQKEEPLAMFIFESMLELIDSSELTELTAVSSETLCSRCQSSIDIHLFESGELICTQCISDDPYKWGSQAVYEAFGASINESDVVFDELSTVSNDYINETTENKILIWEKYIESMFKSSVISYETYEECKVSGPLF
jgi:hypothetical protein